MKFIKPISYIFLLLAATGCTPKDSGIGIEQLKEDLVGEPFFVNFTWGSGRGGDKFTVSKVQQIYDLAIERRLTDTEEGLEEIYALVTVVDKLDRPRLAYRGVLVFTYKKYAQEWAYSSVQPEAFGEGKSFEFEYISADELPNFEAWHDDAVKSSLANLSKEETQELMTSNAHKQMINNLRQIAAGADQYFLENGKAAVSLDDLLNREDIYVEELTPVGKETYPKQITVKDTYLSTQGSEYGDVKIDF